VKLSSGCTTCGLSSSVQLHAVTFVVSTTMRRELNVTEKTNKCVKDEENVWFDSLAYMFTALPYYNRNRVLGSGLRYTPYMVQHLENTEQSLQCSRSVNS
jgi:hypothetical protein